MSGDEPKVLIVHIDEQALIGLEQRLEDLGFRTTTTWDAGEAAHLLGSRSFDLVVIGDRPPVVSARELIAQAPPANAQSKFVVLQADTSFTSACLEQVRLRQAMHGARSLTT